MAGLESTRMNPDPIGYDIDYGGPGSRVSPMYPYRPDPITELYPGLNRFINDSVMILQGTRDRFPRINQSVERHATASYELAKRHGVLNARIAGALNEIEGFLRYDLPNLREKIEGDEPWAFQLEDLRANELGFLRYELERTRGEDG